MHRCIVLSGPRGLSSRELLETSPRWTGRDIKSELHAESNSSVTAVGCGFDCFIMKPTFHKLSILTSNQKELLVMARGGP